MSEPPPLDFGDEDLFAIPSKAPATRTADHPTSVKAAARVAAEQETIKARVLRFAKDGYTIVFVGHKNHDEAVGTVGEVDAGLVAYLKRI